MIFMVVMYLTETISRSKNKSYRCVLLRESYREEGKVRNRTLANLSRCKSEEIEAIRLALKFKGDPERLGAMEGKIEIAQGPRVGAVWTVYDVARRLGIEGALGRERAGRLALWQVLARVIAQGFPAFGGSFGSEPRGMRRAGAGARIRRERFV